MDNELKERLKEAGINDVLFTQSDMDAAITSRLARAESSFKADSESEIKELKRINSNMERLHNAGLPIKLARHDFSDDDIKEISDAISPNADASKAGGSPGKFTKSESGDGGPKSVLGNLVRGE